MIEIRGDYGEGGGQILRTSLALSALTGRPFRIHRLRHGRKPPGLRPQHLAAVRLAARLCGARVEGDHPGSQELTFRPGTLRAGRFSLDVRTAGSLTLVLQAVLLPALFAPGKVRLELRGGTDVLGSPPLDYLSAVLLPYFRMLGRVRETVVSRGFYPQGGGQLEVEVVSELRAAPEWPSLAGEVAARVPPMDLEGARPLERIRGCSVATAALRGRRVAERQAEAARLELARTGVPVSVEESYTDAPSTGSVIVLWAEGRAPGRWPWRMGADRLGRRGLPAEEVGASAARALLERLAAGPPVEEHLADNLVPLLALAGGSMEVQAVSRHTRSNMYVVEQFAGRRFACAGHRIAWL